MSGNVSQSPSSTLFNSRVKLLQTDDQSIKCPAVHHTLGQLWGVLGYSTEDKGCSLLVESLRERVREGEREREGEGEKVSYISCINIINKGMQNLETNSYTNFIHSLIHYIHVCTYKCTCTYSYHANNTLHTDTHTLSHFAQLASTPVVVECLP